MTKRTTRSKRKNNLIIVALIIGIAVLVILIYKFVYPDIANPAKQAAKEELRKECTQIITERRNASSVEIISCIDVGINVSGLPE